MRSGSTEVPLKSTFCIVFHNQNFTLILLKTFFYLYDYKEKNHDKIFSKTVNDVVLRHCPYLADRKYDSKSASKKNLRRK